MTYEEMISANNPILEFDASGKPITPDLILANKDGSYIGIITNVSNFTDGYYMNNPYEISFTVSKKVDGKECWVWDDVKDFKLVYSPQHAEWYEITINISESTETTKSVNGLHAQEAELSQRLIFETEINTEDDIARDDYVVTKFYDPDHVKGSLLHRLLADKCQDYTIFHVDNSLRDIQRTFSFNKKSVKDCLDEVADEVECLFVYGESFDDDGKLHRTISAYDLLDYCTNCGKRGIYINGRCTNCDSNNIIKGYGNETNIFISRENIASSITLKTNADKVKNCFRLEAGDDVMTAVIRSINPNGSQYIWYFSDDMRSDMSNELRVKLIDYDNLYSQYQQGGSTYSVMTLMDSQGNTLTDSQDTPLGVRHNSDAISMDLVPQELITQYNALVDKYVGYNGQLSKIVYPIYGVTNLIAADYKSRYMYDFLKNTMMPGSSEVQDTTAAEQIQNLTVANLSPVGLGGDKNLSNVSLATANSAVTAYAKLWVDTSRYKVEVINSTYNNPIWRGSIVVSSYTKDEDTATTPMLSITLNVADATYIQQSVDKAMKKMETQNLGSVALFHMSDTDFKNELKKYSLSYLGILRDVADACLDILIEQGVGEAQQDLYQQIYLPYYRKSGFIEDELVVREGELAILLAPNRDAKKGLIDYIEKQREAVREALDMPTFLGEDLWQELIAFRRDDVYQNNNYISDGLSDSELIDNAQQFYDAALKEIKKSAELQSTLSGKLQNFLLMPEFQNIAQYVKLGNKIYLEIDDKVYQLRLISYEIDYSRIDGIDIAFSDVVKAGDLVSDIRSVLDQARSIATSYSATARQANKGSMADAMLNNWVVNGLDLTSKKIVNTADNQNMIIDQSGLYMRRSLDFEDGYSMEQTKMINAGIYYTTDGWRTVKAGLGRFKYIHPETGEEVTDFGVIANTVMGDLIIGNKLNIFNSNGTVKMDADGTIFTLRDNEDNSSVFKIRKDNGNNTYTDLLSINASNQLVLNGSSVKISAGNTTGDIASTGNIIATINASSEGVTISASKVNLTGYVTMTNLSTAGQTTINGGNVTTGTMSAERIKGGTLTLGGSNNTNGSLSVLNASGTQIGSWNKDGVTINSGSLNIGNGVFKVTTAGALTATSATISGKITATSGTIGGFTIGSSAIYNGMTSYGDTTHNGVFVSTSGIALGKGAFKVSNAGAMTASNATITGTVTSTGSNNTKAIFSNAAIQFYHGSTLLGGVATANSGTEMSFGGYGNTGFFARGTLTLSAGGTSSDNRHFRLDLKNDGTTLFVGKYWNGVLVSCQNHELRFAVDSQNRLCYQIDGHTGWRRINPDSTDSGA